MVTQTGCRLGQSLSRPNNKSVMPVMSPRNATKRITDSAVVFVSPIKKAPYQNRCELQPGRREVFEGFYAAEDEAAAVRKA